MPHELFQTFVLKICRLLRRTTTETMIGNNYSWWCQRNYLQRANIDGDWINSQIFVPDRFSSFWFIICYLLLLGWSIQFQTYRASLMRLINVRIFVLKFSNQFLKQRKSRQQINFNLIQYTIKKNLWIFCRKILFTLWKKIEKIFNLGNNLFIRDKSNEFTFKT